MYLTKTDLIYILVVNLLTEISANKTHEPQSPNHSTSTERAEFTL